MCHGVCQVLVHLEDGKVVKITGDKDSPLSRGYICPKGVASPEMLYHPDRLTHPLRRTGKKGENKWERISWDDALDEMAERFSAIKKESGPEYLALMRGCPKPSMDFFERFANAFGTPNFTGPDHLCDAPRIIANIYTIGQLAMPVCDVYGFGDKRPECILLWGTNITEIGGFGGMCGGMVKRAIKDADKLIVIDPRRTGPAKNADHWLQIRPGTDGALALAMLNTIIAEDLIDHEFVEKYTIGFERLSSTIRQYTPEWAEPVTGIASDEIRRAAITYATTKPACIQVGNGIDMSHCCFHTARSIMILRAITGNLDRPGGDVLWETPEKVKMKSQFVNHEITGKVLLPVDKIGLGVDGKRYPSAITRSIAAKAGAIADIMSRPLYPLIVRFIGGHLGFAYKTLSRIKSAQYPLCPTVHAPTFWKSILEEKPYRTRGLWIMGSNPLLSGTNPLGIEDALGKLEYLVVSELFMTPTAQFADLVLPSSMWLEQDDVVNTYKQWCVIPRRKVAQRGEVRDDRDVIIALARRMGMKRAFPWKDNKEFIEKMLHDTGMNFERFCEEKILTGKMRYFKYKDQGFSTPSGKFEIYSKQLKGLGVSPLPLYREPPLTPVSAPDIAEDYPLILTTGVKVKQFFHSEGRQIHSLRKANPFPLVEIHPETARSLNIEDGAWVWIETHAGRVQMQARLFDGLKKNVVSTQNKWWYPEDDPPEYGWKRSNINLLFSDMAMDPDFGSESLRSALCRIYPVEKE